MTNQDIAQIFSAIGDYLFLKGVRFKPQAYQAAAQFIQHTPQDITKTYRRGGIKALEELPEIGESMAKKIAELIETGRLEYFERLRKAWPIDAFKIMSIQVCALEVIELSVEA